MTWLLDVLAIDDGEDAQETSWPPPAAVSPDSNVLLILLVPFQLFAAIFRKSYGMLYSSYRIEMYRFIKLERH